QSVKESARHHALLGRLLPGLSATGSGQGRRCSWLPVPPDSLSTPPGSTRTTGYDPSSAYEYTIPLREKAVLKTDIQLAVPSGRVAPCSGLVAKLCAAGGTGAIDEDYRGCVSVGLLNFGKEKSEVKRKKVTPAHWCTDILSRLRSQNTHDTGRGSGGSSCTGKVKNLLTLL
ncbi:hypothetical protein U0070_025141, partial [Myodes glareolus]